MDHNSTGSRAVVDLTVLHDQDKEDSPVVVQGTFVDVRADRGWTNLPESDITEAADVTETEFDSEDVSFRTILATLEIDAVLRDGGEIETPEVRSAIAADGRIDLTLILYNDSTVESARTQLMSLAAVVIPVAESLRGAFGVTLTPYSGYDIIIDVLPDNALAMPLSDEVTRDFVLGTITSYDELVTVLAA